MYVGVETGHYLRQEWDRTEESLKGFETDVVPKVMETCDKCVKPQQRIQLLKGCYKKLLDLDNRLRKIHGVVQSLFDNFKLSDTQLLGFQGPHIDEVCEGRESCQFLINKVCLRGLEEEKKVRKQTQRARLLPAQSQRMRASSPQAQNNQSRTFSSDTAVGQSEPTSSSLAQGQSGLTRTNDPGAIAGQTSPSKASSTQPRLGQLRADSADFTASQLSSAKPPSIRSQLDKSRINGSGPPTSPPVVVKPLPTHSHSDTPVKDGSGRNSGQPSSSASSVRTSHVRQPPVMKPPEPPRTAVLQQAKQAQTPQVPLLSSGNSHSNLSSMPTGSAMPPPALPQMGVANGSNAASMDYQMGNRASVGSTVNSTRQNVPVIPQDQHAQRLAQQLPRRLPHQPSTTQLSPQAVLSKASPRISQGYALPNPQYLPPTMVPQQISQQRSPQPQLPRQSPPQSSPQMPQQFQRQNPQALPLVMSRQQFSQQVFSQMPQQYSLQRPQYLPASMAQSRQTQQQQIPSRYTVGPTESVPVPGSPRNKPTEAGQTNS